MMIFWTSFAVALVCFCASLLALLPISHGAIRILDFPKLQFVAVTSVFLIISLVWAPLDTMGLVLVGMLATATLVQISYLVRFTPIWPRSVASASGGRSARALRILVCNVKQGNTEYAKVAALIEMHDPDIAVFMETGKKWREALRQAIEPYGEKLIQIQENSYGMILVSRLNLVRRELRFLLKEEVPSFDCVAELPDGEQFRLYALHPEPPMPSEDSVGRDAEIALVGKIVRDESKPVIVTGDLNDVAWSRTTRRFLRISRLLDPREGRGFYCSFDARYFFLRWPLDHIFISSHFEIAAISRLSYVGSDHFPMLFDLVLKKEASDSETQGGAAKSDLEEADRLISAEKHRDKAPAGEDWED